MKKALSICLFLSLMAGCLLTGCGSNTTDDSSSVAETTAATTATEAETTAEETEAETETTAEESADAKDAETTTAAKEKDTSKDGNLWADFDNMSFKINGKTYTLGKTTLQEMIDDGVPFDENDLANAGNNINPRYESSSFEIKLGERSFAQVRVLNDSSDNKKASECFIDNVYMPIYDEPQDILEFNFPLTMTQEELLLLLYDELVKRLRQADLEMGKQNYENFITVNAGNLDAMIELFRTDERFQVVSSPTLRVKSGSKGNFSVGSDVPVLSNVTYQDGRPVQAIEYRSSGVIFDIQPTIKSNAIDLKINQQLSNFVKTDTGVNQSPTLIKRDIVTDVTVKSGDVIVLGGLAENKITEGETGFSFLPKGILTGKSKSNTKTDIVILLQVKMI